MCCIFLRGIKNNNMRDLLRGLWFLLTDISSGYVCCWYSQFLLRVILVSVGSGCQDCMWLSGVVMLSQVDRFEMVSTSYFFTLVLALVLFAM